MERARQRVTHGSRQVRRRPLRAAAVAIAVVGAASVLPGPWGAPLVTGPASLVPALLATAALTAALLGGWRQGTPAHRLATAGSGAATVAYVLGLRALGTLTEPGLVRATPRWGDPGALSVAGVVARGGWSTGWPARR